MSKMYDELIKSLRAHNGWALNKTLDDAADAIEALSQENESLHAELGKAIRELAKLQKGGHWTLNKDGSGTCSECGRTQKNCWDLDNWDNFCHFCGADMREES